MANWTVKAQHPLMVMVAPADKALQVCPPGKVAGACGPMCGGHAVVLCQSVLLLHCRTIGARSEEHHLPLPVQGRAWCVAHHPSTLLTLSTLLRICSVRLH